MLPLIRRMVEAYPSIPAWRLALVNFLTEADRLEEARVEFEPVAARGFDSSRGTPTGSSGSAGSERRRRGSAISRPAATCSRGSRTLPGSS